MNCRNWKTEKLELKTEIEKILILKFRIVVLTLKLPNHEAIKNLEFKSEVSYKPYSKSIQTAAVKSEKWKKKLLRQIKMMERNFSSALEFPESRKTRVK